MEGQDGRDQRPAAGLGETLVGRESVEGGALGGGSGELGGEVLGEDGGPGWEGRGLWGKNGGGAVTLGSQSGCSWNGPQLAAGACASSSSARSGWGPAVCAVCSRGRDQVCVLWAQDVEVDV